MAGQLEPPDHTFDMRVDYHGRLSERIPQNDIGGFSPHPRQGRESLHRVRNLLVELVPHHLGTLNEMFGFRLKEPGCADQVLQFGRPGVCVITRTAVASKELRGHLVDTLVGTLRRQNGRHQKFPGIGVVEFHFQIGYRSAQRGQYSGHPALVRWAGRCMGDSWFHDARTAANCEAVRTEMQVSGLEEAVRGLLPEPEPVAQERQATEFRGA